LATAGWILSHKPEQVTVRDVRRGDSLMRRMDGQEAEMVLDQLDAFRWLNPVPSIRKDSKVWAVNPIIYTLFEDRADEEYYQRMTARDLIADSVKLQ
jgi:hypothetical protein